MKSRNGSINGLRHIISSKTNLYIITHLHRYVIQLLVARFTVQLQVISFLCRIMEPTSPTQSPSPTPPSPRPDHEPATLPQPAPASFVSAALCAVQQYILPSPQLLPAPPTTSPHEHARPETPPPQTPPQMPLVQDHTQWFSLIRNLLISVLLAALTGALYFIGGALNNMNNQTNRR